MTVREWWGLCPDCGYHIDTPNHVLGCAAERANGDGQSDDTRPTDAQAIGPKGS